MLWILAGVLVAQAVACGWFASVLAEHKGHPDWPWFWAGLLAGPLGLLAAVGLPDRAGGKAP